MTKETLAKVEKAKQNADAGQTNDPEDDAPMGETRDPEAHIEAAGPPSLYTNQSKRGAARHLAPEDPSYQFSMSQNPDGENPLKQQKNSLSLFQANVQKSRAAHLTALQTAVDNHYDIICLQEPWAMPDIRQEKTLSCPPFRTFAPENSWSNRPRTLLYAQRDLDSEQTYLQGPFPDLTAINVKMKHQDPITVISIYNPPARSAR